MKERKCPFCDTVENEKHILLDRTLYDDLRFDLFNRTSTIEMNFHTFQKENKMIFFYSPINL